MCPLSCCVRLCLASLYICLHVACNLSTCVSQLWTAVAASALLFFSQLWTSQALVAESSDFENYKLFGVYGGVVYPLFSGVAKGYPLAKQRSRTGIGNSCLQHPASARRQLHVVVIASRNSARSNCQEGFRQNPTQEHILASKRALKHFILQKTKWSPRTRMQTRSKSYICPRENLVGHSCKTLLWDTLVGHCTLVGHSCRKLWRGTLVGHSYGTLLWVPCGALYLGHSCGTLYLGRSCGCGTLLLDTLVGHSCQTLLWDTLVGHSCPTLLGHSCRKLLRGTLVGHS